MTGWFSHRLSTSTRLALTFSALLAGFAVVTVSFLFVATTTYMDRQLDSTILTDADGLAEQFGQRGLPGVEEAIQSRINNPFRRGGIYLMADPSFKPVVGNVNQWPVTITSTLGWFEIVVERDGTASIARILHYVLPNGYHLLVGRDAEDRIALQRLIVQVLATVLLVALILALGGGFVFRRLFLRRMAPFTTTAAKIGAGDMRQRIPRVGGSDEFDALAGTINAMLDRIERLMDGVRQVSNAIAHDLRTPLAHVRGRLETIAASADLAPEAREAVESSLHEIEELLNVFSALLRIAEIDVGARRSAFAEVDAAQMLVDLADLYQAAAEERGLRFVFEPLPGLTCFGDRHLLAQAVANLLDNAIKFSPDGATVRLSALRRAGAIVFAVADRGPGIPAAEREKVRQRFYRLEQSRHSPGSGLGLALVDAVARLHDGDLRLLDHRPGLVAELVLPERKPTEDA